MMRRRLMGPAVWLLVALGACGGGEGAGETTIVPAAATSTTGTDSAVTETESAVVITIAGLSFPDQATVPAGKSVIWANESSSPHQVQMETHDGAPAEVDSVRIGPDQEGELRLEAGTWEYFCTIHPSSMTGSLLVEG